MQSTFPRRPVRRPFEIELDALRRQARAPVRGSAGDMDLRLIRGSALQPVAGSCGCSGPSMRARGRSVRRIEIVAPPRPAPGTATRRFRAPLGGPSFAILDRHPFSDTFVADPGLPAGFEFAGFEPNLGLVASADPLLPNMDPGQWGGGDPEMFPDAFVGWTDATLVAGGMGYACLSSACSITDPLEPIVLGPDSAIDLVIGPAQFQWFWVGVFATPLQTQGQQVTIEVSAGPDAIRDATTEITSLGSGAVHGACARVRQRIPGDAIGIHLSRGRGTGNQDVYVLVAGRLGLVPS